MKRIHKVVLIAGLLGAAVASASPAVQFRDWARVVSSSPRYEQINQPRQVCRRETIYVPAAEYDNSGAVIGGIAGGIIGSQVGRGNGQVAAAAIGAATGALVGDRLQGGYYAGSVPRTEKRCVSVDQWQSRLVGYDVVYEYQGRTWNSFMTQAPGDFVRLQVSLQPE